MGFAKVQSAQTFLLKAHIVDVEVDSFKGLPSFSIVGLPDKAVEEAKDRVSAAIKNLGFRSPKTRNQKITVSLAPASLKKEGAIFDLPITLAYLLSTGEISFNPEGKLFLGELSLDAKLRPIRGALPITLEARNKGFTEVYLPEENAKEAAVIDGIKIFGAKTAEEILRHLRKGKKRDGGEKEKFSLKETPRTEIFEEETDYEYDVSSVRGQEFGKRALLICASGGHNLSLEGHAGTGKTMLARALPSILPPLSFEEMLEVMAIHSINGVLEERGLISSPPFRSPHHTSSYAALVGGGANLRPGEITLAHRGVLFLDEFPEFERRVIESLREPLEEGKISLSRSKGSSTFPARFIFVAALNPCPCGNLGSSKECVCTAINIQRYRKKISGPIADRIDIHVTVPLIPHEKLLEKRSGETSESFRKKVLRAREIQQKRNSVLKKKGKLNAHLSARDIEELIH